MSNINAKLKDKLFNINQSLDLHLEPNLTWNLIQNQNDLPVGRVQVRLLQHVFNKSIIITAQKKWQKAAINKS